MERLWRIRLAIGYHDDYVKCQTWNRDFIQQTESLVFSIELMGKAEQEEFIPRRDWRDNPCLVRYRVGGRPPEPICERGENGPKLRKSQERGRPLGIEFQLRSDDGTIRAYHSDIDWIRNTATLIFQHELQANNHPVEPVITHITLDDVKSILDIEKTLIPGKMRFSSVSKDLDGHPDPFLCGFPGLTGGVII